LWISTATITVSEIAGDVARDQEEGGLADVIHYGGHLLEQLDTLPGGEWEILER
jgi:hypothetical protein